MKKLLLFTLILSIVLIFVSCVNTNTKTTVRINLKGSPIISSTQSRASFEDLWDTIVISVTDNNGDTVDTIEKSKTDLNGNYIEFTKTNFSGDYTISVFLKNKNTATQIASGETLSSVSISAGYNETSIELKFYSGGLIFVPERYDNITYKYHLIIQTKDNQIIRDLDNLTEDGTAVINLSPGVYHIRANIYEGNNLVWANDGNNGFSDLPFIAEVKPSQNSEILLDPLSKNKITFIYPFLRTIPYDLSVSQIVGSSNVQFSWNYDNYSNNPTFLIYKKKAPSKSYEFVAKFEPPYTELITDGSYFEYTEPEVSKGSYKYAVNVIENGKESGYVETGDISVVTP